MRISTHKLTWSVTLDLASENVFCYISTHTLTWSVTSPFENGGFIMIFQLTRSRGAWLLISQKFGNWIKFQLTRSRGAWQKFGGATATYIHFNSHAHVERDSSKILLIIVSIYFNSHAHVERDIHRCRFFWTLDISTHTLTWSVTKRTNRRAATLRNFNSHAHVERDWHTLDCLAPSRWFQLTRSRGAWRMLISWTIRLLAFQLTRSRGAWRNLP